MKRKKSAISLFIATLMLSLLVACASNSNLEEIEQLKAANELLQTENEQLQMDLETATTNLEAVESKIEELEITLQKTMDEMETMEKSEEEQIPVEIIPPELSPSESLIGEWHYQELVNYGGTVYLQSMAFNTDGTGKIIQTHYLPNDTLDYSTSDPNFTGESSDKFVWTLDGDRISVKVGNGESVYFSFSPDEQQLKLETGSSKTQIYKREYPSDLANYFKVSVFLNEKKAQEASLMRNLLGNWYYDVLVWTFNEDGTGVLDIPELGESPATQMNFSYSVSGEQTDMMITIEWSDSRISFYWPTVNADGSIILQGASDTEPFKLTRRFDPDNCPITKAILSNTMGVLSGSIFSDFLP